jgi:bacterioferritin (cytochrome b1)
MKDPTTRVLLEEILAVEEEHAQDMAGLLANLDPTLDYRAENR